MMVGMPWRMQGIQRGAPYSHRRALFQPDIGAFQRVQRREGDLAAYFALEDGELSAGLNVRIGGVDVPRQLWPRVRPKAGVMIEVTGVPMRNSGLLQAVLLIAVTVFAWYAAPYVAGFLGVTSQFGIAAIGAGLYITGSLCIPAHIERAR